MHTNWNDDAASLHAALFDATEGELATRMLYFVNEIFAKAVSSLRRSIGQAGVGLRS